MLLSSLLLALATAQAAEPARVAVLFDNATRSGVVLYGFERVASGWGPPSFSHPPLRWTRCLDGTARGELRLQGPLYAAALEQVAALELAHGQGQQFLGKRRIDAELQYGDAKTSYRPLVLSASGLCADPENWKRESPPPETLARLRAVFEAQSLKSTHGDDACGEKPRVHKAGDVKLVASYRAKAGLDSGAWLATLTMAQIFDWSGETQVLPCNYQHLTFWLPKTGEPVFLGYDLVLVDAGDYDGDGHSELVFFKNGYPEQSDDPHTGIELFSGSPPVPVDLMWEGD